MGRALKYDHQGSFRTTVPVIKKKKIQSAVIPPTQRSTPLETVKVSRSMKFADTR